MKTITLTTRDFFTFKALAHFIYQYAYNGVNDRFEITALETELADLGY